MTAERLRQVDVALGERSYPIYIGAGLLARPELLAPWLTPAGRRSSRRVLVVSNETVAPLYMEACVALFAAAGCETERLVLPDGEAHKTLATADAIFARLLRGRFDRASLLVALGGGVIGDLTGFAAATYQRGIDFAQIPTTLLAQVDSSVGGKTGVNHALGKNMIGAFHQPRCVLVDTDVLATLPARELRAGLAEVVKYGLLGDVGFFDWLCERSAAILRLDSEPTSEAIRRCCLAKSAVVAADEREAGARALLNLGHTFGHAIEAATGYREVLHGEAVAMGMVMAADLSMRSGFLPAAQARQIKSALAGRFGLPVAPPPLEADAMLEFMAADKKSQGGRIHFVLLRAIGEAFVTADVAAGHLRETLTAGAALCE